MDYDYDVHGLGLSSLPSPHPDSVQWEICRPRPLKVAHAACGAAWHWPLLSPGSAKRRYESFALPAVVVDKPLSFALRLLDARTLKGWSQDWQSSGRQKQGLSTLRSRSHRFRGHNPPMPILAEFVREPEDKRNVQHKCKKLANSLFAPGERAPLLWYAAYIIIE